MGNPALASALVGAIKQQGLTAPKPPAPIKLTNPYTTPVGAPKPAKGLISQTPGLISQQTPSPTGGPVDPTDPKTLGLLSTNQALQAKIAALGATPSSGHPSVFHRILDLVSRPEYAVANFALKGDEAKTHGKSVVNQITSGLSGAVKGIEGKDKTLPQDVVQQLRDAQHARGKKGLGLFQPNGSEDYTPGEAGPIKSILGRLGLAALNVVSDPLTYTGAGTIDKVAQGTKALGKTADALRDFLPTANKLADIGAVEKSDIAVRGLLGPKLKETAEGFVPGRPNVAMPSMATEGERQAADLLTKTHRAVQSHVTDQVTEDLAKQGRKIETVPQPTLVHDYSDPEKVAASWKKYQKEVENHEIRQGVSYDVQKPNELSRTGFIKAVHDARIAGNTERVNELLRDPSTGRSLLEGAPKNAGAAYAYDRHFALLNRGAKSADEYSGIKAARDAYLKSNDPKLISARKLANKNLSEANAIHQVAVTRSDVKAAEEYIGRDPAKLKFLPSGIKTGAYAEHLKTLPNRITEEEKKVGHPLTSEERAPIEDAWWQQQYVNYAKFSKIIASKTFDDSTAGLKNWVAAKLAEPHVGINNTRQRLFAEQEHHAIRKAQAQMLNEIRDANKGTRVKVNELKSARDEAAAEGIRKPTDFTPKRQDTTGPHRVIEQNRSLQEEINDTVAKQSGPMYEDLKTSIMAAMHQGFSPDSIKVMSLRVGGKVVLTSPEFISNYIRKVVAGDNLVNHALKAWDHAFVSTGKMLPEIAGMKASSEGQVAQLSRRMSMSLMNDFQGTKLHDAMHALEDYVKGNTPVDAELTAKLDKHFQSLAETLRNPKFRVLGVRPQDISAMMPDKFKIETWPKAAVIKAALDHQDTTVVMIRNAVKDIFDKGKIKDPAQFINALNIGKYRAVFAAELKDNIEQSFGISVKDGLTGKESEGAKALRAQGFRSLRKKTEHGMHIPEATDLTKRGFIFDPKIANDLDRMLELVHDNKSVEDLSRYIDRALLQPWRAATTVYNFPSYAFRNGMQNFFMTWLALADYGSNSASLAKNYARSAKWLKEAPPDDLKFSLDPYHTALHGPVGESDPQNIRMMRAVNTRGYKLGDIPGEWVTLRHLEGLWLKHGGDSGYFTSQFGNTARVTGGIRQLAGKINTQVANANKVAENYHRKALFMDAFEHSIKNTADEKAADAMHIVHKYLFDYHDLTGFEKATMTRFFPFYKWTRKAFPLMFENMLMQPGKVFGVTKAQYTLAGEQQPNNPWYNDAQTVVPDWLSLGTEKVPFMHHGGNQAYGSLPLPFNDLGDQFFGDTSNKPIMGALSGAGSMVNPLFRIPAELVTGHEFYHQLPIPDGAVKYSTIDQFPQFSKFTSFLNSMKAQNQGSTATSGAGAKSSIPFSLLKNSGLTEVTENTPSSQNSQLTASNQKLEAQRKKLLAALTKG